MSLTHDLAGSSIAATDVGCCRESAAGKLEAMMRVAVITRTKDRDLLLRRALRSVLGQSFRDFVWVVVNDGGDPSPVEAVGALARHEGRTVRLVHHATSLGMEAASNAGLEAAESEYVLIHDDDDSLQPEFLSKTVDFLDREAGFAGVVTGFAHVAERVQAHRVIHLGTWSAKPLRGAVQLTDLATENPFPPICFLYRRSVLARLGGYDESLPVLGDWDFNLRLLRQWDVAALPECLANYHHRLGNRSGPFGNTIHASLHTHAAYDALIRNRFLREDLAQGRAGVGHLLFHGRIALNTRNEMTRSWLGPFRDIKRKMLILRSLLSARFE